MLATTPGEEGATPLPTRQCLVHLLFASMAEDVQDQQALILARQRGQTAALFGSPPGEAAPDASSPAG